MRDTVNMRKRLSAERENAVLKTYFVLTKVQGLRGMSTYPGNHCAHTLPSLPEFRNGPAVAKQCLSGVDRESGDGVDCLERMCGHV